MCSQGSQSHVDCIQQNLSQREAFATDACNYVAKAIDDGVAVGTDAAIVSFSFVNTDLRTIFRKRFPKSEWLLIETNDAEASNRIKQRTGHFYNGNTSREKMSEPEHDNDAGRNSEWTFAAVDFQHTIVDGMLPIGDNARLVADVVKGAVH
jgi:gluconate kinase